jgi:hypothetical protein
MRRRQLWSPLRWIGPLAFLLCTSRLNAAGGVPVLLTFDNLAVGTDVHTFPGLTLVTFGTNNFDGTPHFTIVQPPQGTVSPMRALQSHFDTGAEFSGTHMTMAFDIPQSLVTLSTGVVVNSPTGPGSAFLLQGFAQDPSTAGTVPIVQSVTTCQGTSPTRIGTPLGIVDQASRIQFAVLSLVACNLPTDPNSGGDHLSLVIDNIAYERELHPPAHENIPPVVTIIDPLNAATVAGSAPQEIAYLVRATIQESDLDKVTAAVNGSPAGPVFYSSSGPNSYNASLFVTASQGLVAGTNTIALTAKDFDRPPNTGSASVTFNFQPKPPPAPSTVDIIPIAYDVTQAIDTGPHEFGSFVNPILGGFEIRHEQVFDVPLIAGKPALVRVFAAAAGTSSAVNNVPALMFVDKDNCTSGCSLAIGMPPINGFSSSGSPAPLVAGITVSPIGTPASDPNATKQNLSSTWNFYLPGRWTRQDLVVDIQLNAGNYSGGFTQQPKIQECSSPIAGECFNNNEIRLHLKFRPPNQLTVNPVFINVSGTTAKTTQSQFDAVIAELNELYPIDVRAGTSQEITVASDRSNDDLLDDIDDASGSQPCFGISGNGSEVWVGLFPGDQGTFSANANGVTGTANVGSEPCAVPAAWTNGNDGVSAAHEIGHTIGFDHWGCEHNGDEECVVFPIPHGGIGGVGIDLANFTVIPLDPSTSPPHAHDFMVTFVNESFKWVSWFTYGILVDHSTFGSYDAPDPTMLFVSGHISPGGVATLRPVFRIDVVEPPSQTLVEDDPDDIYTIRVYDEAGNTLYLQNFEPQKRGIHDPHHRRAYEFAEVIPLIPDLQRVGVFKHGSLLGELKPLYGRLEATLAVKEPKPGAVWSLGSKQRIEWTLKGGSDEQLAALVEYSIDGGKSRHVLRRDVKGNFLTVDADQIPGTDDAAVFVQLSDGIHTVEAQSGRFRVAVKPPFVHIMTPAADGALVHGMPATLSGRGFDRQERLPDDAFHWTSSKDGALGTGLSLTTSSLSLGVHTITLRVTNHSGLPGRDSVRIHVVKHTGNEKGEYNVESKRSRYP